MRTIKDAAPIMGLTERAVYARIVKGQLPGVVKRRGRWMIPDDVLDPFTGTVTVTAAARFLHKEGAASSRQSIYNWIKEGRLTEIRDGIGIHRIKKSELNELVGVSARKGDD